MTEQEKKRPDDEAIMCPKCCEWAKRNHNDEQFRCDNPVCLWRGTSTQTPRRIISL